MENILDEFDSLREILGRKRPVENVEERSSLLKKMRNLRDLENSCDVSSKDMIASAVEAMERAVEAVLEKSKSNLQNDEQTTIDDDEDEALPETARPYQPIAFNQKKPLNINQALKYFEEEEKSITEMPLKPKAGEVILFRAKSSAHLQDWRSTGQRWYQINGGTTSMKGMIKRKVSNIVTPTSGERGLPTFQRICWTHRDKPMLVLVQYVGDDSVSIDFPHKNSKKDIPYTRTAPSVLRELEVTSKKPFQAYQEAVFNAPTDATTQSLRVPRNITQVRNSRQKFRREKRGTDSLTNLIRQGLEYEDMRFLMVSPDIVMVSITPEMLKQAKEILKINYNTARNKQVLGYDTQFNLGDYYTSWITIRDIRYIDKKSGKCPILPIVQVVHERKLQLHHHLAWEVITDLIPEIKTQKLIAVSDDEFTPLLQNFVKKGLVAKCEIHGVKKIERWISNHGGHKGDGQVLKSDFRCILFDFYSCILFTVSPSNILRSKH